jgi:hypothetical protein
MDIDKILDKTIITKLFTIYKLTQLIKYDVSKTIKKNK